MDILELLKYVGGGVAGTILGIFLNHRVNIKKHNLTEFEVIIREYKQMNDDLQARYEMLLNRVNDLEVEVQILRDENRKLKDKA